MDELEKLEKAKGAGKAPTTPVGVVGLSASGGTVSEEFLPNLRWPQAAKVYQEMSLNDPVIGSILYLNKMLIRRVSWKAASNVEGTTGDDLIQFVNECIGDMNTSWADLISEILSMFVYGFSFHEIVYKVRRGPAEKNPQYKSAYSDAKFGWQNMPVRSQASLDTWMFDEIGNVIGFKQASNDFSPGGEIPIDRGLLFRTESSRENPEGKSLLRNAYRPWYFKKNIEELEGIGIERSLAGVPVLTPPEGVNLWDKDNEEMIVLLAQAEKLVSGLRKDSSSGIVKPFGWELDLLSTSGSGTVDTNTIINRHDNRIAITMLSDLVLIGADKTGSFALADTKKSLLTMSLETHLKTIADVFNKQAIPRLMELNGFLDPTKYPILVHDDLENPTLSDLALVLRATGLRLKDDPELEDFVRKIMNAPALRDSEKREGYTVTKPEDNKPGESDDPKKNDDPRKGPQDPVDNKLK